MAKRLPMALSTARRYAKHYAEGGLASATEMGAKFYSAPAVAPFDKRFEGDSKDPNVPEYNPGNIDRPVGRGSPVGLPDPTQKQYFHQKVKVASAGGKVEQKRKYTMPLKPGSDKKTVSQNIREFHTGPTYAHTAAKFGKDRARKQAIAVAMSSARKYAGKGKALGGPNENMEAMVTRGAMYGLRREGMINSSIPGRTDRLPMNVRSGSYILPADIPSALGQGNTMAGGNILKKMFSSGPYGLPTMKSSVGRMQRPMRIQQQMMPKKLPGTFARGGGSDEHVPIVAAGGEYIIHPDVVRDVGHGDIKAGHRVLDKFVLNVRKNNIDTLKKLKPPKH